MKHCCETMEYGVKEGCVSCYSKESMNETVDEVEEELKEYYKRTGGTYRKEYYESNVYKTSIENNRGLMWWADLHYCPWCGTKHNGMR